MDAHTDGIKIDRSKIATLSASCPLGNYDPAYDVRVVVAILNSGITDSESLTKFRMWALSLPVINHLMSSESDFPSEYIMTVWNYVDAVHASKSNSLRNHIFTHALWYLRCMCSHRIQSGVLSWIQDSNNSAIHQTSCSTPVQESSNYISLELLSLA